MGFKNNKIIKNNGFEPIDLNYGNVQSIYNSCLAQPEDATTYAQIMEKLLSGKDSRTVEFSKERVKQNSRNISYLLGQLNGVHEGSRLIQMEYGILNYNKKRWTTMAEPLLQLYELGFVNRNITVFTQQSDKSLATDISTIEPTLSPKDPNFPAWWEEHKAEWETPKKEVFEEPKGHQ